MLKYLRVRNLAIIREISLDLLPGLTAVTGETGAGKSILVDSLSLLMGERGGVDRTRSGEGSASVEAVFDLRHRPDLRSYLAERGGEVDEEEIILRREIAPAGRSRAFIGSRLASLSGLREVGRRLLDLHGQHEHQILLRPSEHRDILDRFGGHAPARARLADLASEIRRARSRLGALTRDRREVARRVEVLRFQVDEIDRAAVRVGEVEELRSERIRVRNQERIRELALTALDRLYEGEGSALANLDGVLAAGRELARYDSQVDSPLARAEEAVLSLRDLADAFRESGREREHDPDRLEAIESRLARLETLARKYGPDEEAIRIFREQAAAELENLTSAEGSVEGIAERLRTLADAYAGEAEALSHRRKRQARALEKAISSELAELAMEGTDVEVEFRIEEDSDSPVRCQGTPVAFDDGGWDLVQFLVRTNPGEPPRPLAKIASGGELSRIMLAVHVVLHRGDDRTLRVFDEVDAGIGGRVAEAVGKKLKRLSRGGQVLCVTHLPQIASLADHHFMVSKVVREGRTEVRAEALDREGSVREVARMLGGEKISELTRRHAAEMVTRGR